MGPASSALQLFSKPIQRWFADRIGEPTAVQEAAWPAIRAGRHLLVAAPTGTGKTLAAFLWAIDRLLEEPDPSGGLQILYISPLKALGNDIRRNLRGPLVEIRELYRQMGIKPPEVRVETRTGDTPPSQRRKMARRPPEILITTPESLNILLTSQSGRSMLDGLSTVICDEIHAVAGTKRGVHLITAVDRLTHMTGEIQRIGLSATVKPVREVARWLGGYRMMGDVEQPVYEPRRVEIIRPEVRKRHDIEVCFPPPATATPSLESAGSAHQENIWNWLVDRLRETIARNRSTLVFANSRRMVEKIARLINEGHEERVVYSHHGSLSRELRHVVEKRLKQGDLAGIVATASLELGIDIGDLDEVDLVQCPFSVAGGVQRIGRSGHRVGEVSRGRIYPLHSRDLLEAAVMAPAMVEGDIEPIRPIHGALDVLAQILVSMACARDWNLDEIHSLLKSSAPYHDLTRKPLELVIDALTGKHPAARAAGLRPLLAFEPATSMLHARPGSARRLYMSGGTIPERGYYTVRRRDDMARLGELDEEFVWERSIGDTLSLGVQAWRIVAITHNDVLVEPSSSRYSMSPFWRAEQRDRDFHVAEKTGVFLEELEKHLEDDRGSGEGNLKRKLERDHLLDSHSARALIDFCRREWEALGGHLPHRHRVVIECVEPPDRERGDQRVVIHTVWGGRINRALALALEQACRRAYGPGVKTAHDDDCVLVTFTEPISERDTRGLLSTLPVEGVERLLRESLPRTGFFGARFREAAGRALMLPKQSFRKRLPLWLNRLRAKKLLDAVSKQKDFPLVLEAWRECLEDELDVETLQKLLAEVEGGEIQVVCATTAAPSPFASGVLWQLTNELMYEDDVPETAGPTVTTDLLREVALSERLRPRIPRKIIEELEEKMQRTFSGYSPQSARELVDWVRERELIPAAEWSRLLDAMERDHHIEASEVATETAPHLVAVRTRDEAGIKAIMVPEAAVALASAFGLTPADLPLGSPTGEKRPSRESLGAVETLWSRNTESRLEPAGVEELAELLGQVLRFHGPISQGRLRELLSPSPEHDELVTEAIGELETGERVVFDRVSEGAASPEVCDIDNLERLLRLTRQASRKRLEPLELDALPLLLAIHQGLARQPEPAPANPADRTEESKEDLRQALEPLFGYPARADLWETEILPARLKRYLPSHLEELMHKERLEWVGCGKKTLTLTLEDERELFQDGAETPSMPADLEETLDHLFPAGSGRFSFEELAARSSLSAQRLTETLWQLAWAGRITTDSFETVRRGVRARFRSAGGPERSGELAGRSKSRARRRRGGARWRPRAVLPGAWHRLSPVDPPEDPLDRDELARERARLLFDRYPVVFRELVQRELPALSWKNLFRALRLMELSGEVLSGCFLRGPTGPQFASKQTYELLRRGLPGDRVYWMNAADPASACGLRLEGFSTKLPARLPTTHLVYHGTDLVLCSRRTGGELTIRVEPGHPRLAEYLDFLRLRLTRSAHPAKRVVVEEINGEPAASSPYAEALSELVEVSRERTSLCLMRRY